MDDPQKSEKHGVRLRLLHIADIHIQDRRRDEYEEVFGNLYDALREEAEGGEAAGRRVVIVVAGDVFDTKTRASPHNYADVAGFLGELVGIAPTILVPGNHDMNLNRPGTLDLLTPVVEESERLRPPGLTYWRTSGRREAAGAIWTVVAPDGEMPPPPRRPPGASVHICLFHEEVEGALLPNGMRYGGARLRLADLEPYDAALGGHIHLQQMLTPKAAYCGSLIQQNFGESHVGHGFLVWDLGGEGPPAVRRVAVPNSRGYLTVELAGGADVTPTPTPDAPYAVRLVYDEATPVAAIQEKMDSLEAEYGFPLRTVRQAAAPQSKAEQADKSAVDKADVSDQSDAATAGDPGGGQPAKPAPIREARDLLATQEGHDALVEEILGQDHKDLASVKAEHRRRQRGEGADGHHQSTRRQRVRLIRLRFDNMYCYGPGNAVDFQALEGGLSGAVAPNRAGKTSLIDIIIYALYDEIPRGNKQTLVNHRSRAYSLRLEFELDGRRGVITKSGQGTGHHHTQVRFEFGGEDLTAGSVQETCKVIREHTGEYLDGALTSFALQEGGPDFVKMKPDERKRTLSRFLRLGMFDELEKTVRRDHLDLRAQIRALDTLKTENLASLTEKHRASAEAAGAAVRAAADASAEREAARSQLETLRGKIAVQVASLGALPEITESESELRAELQAAKKDMASLESAAGMKRLGQQIGGFAPDPNGKIGPEDLGRKHQEAHEALIRAGGALIPEEREKLADKIGCASPQAPAPTAEGLKQLAVTAAAAEKARAQAQMAAPKADPAVATPRAWALGKRYVPSQDEDLEKELKEVEGLSRPELIEGAARIIEGRMGRPENVENAQRSMEAICARLADWWPEARRLTSLTPGDASKELARVQAEIQAELLHGASAQAPAPETPSEKSDDSLRAIAGEHEKDGPARAQALARAEETLREIGTLAVPKAPRPKAPLQVSSKTLFEEASQHPRPSAGAAAEAREYIERNHLGTITADQARAMQARARRTAAEAEAASGVGVGRAAYDAAEHKAMKAAPPPPVKNLAILRESTKQARTTYVQVINKCGGGRDRKHSQKPIPTIRSEMLRTRAEIQEVGAVDGVTSRASAKKRLDEAKVCMMAIEGAAPLVRTLGLFPDRCTGCRRTQAVLSTEGASKYKSQVTQLEKLAALHRTMDALEAEIAVRTAGDAVETAENAVETAEAGARRRERYEYLEAVEKATETRARTNNDVARLEAHLEKIEITQAAEAWKAYEAAVARDEWAQYDLSREAAETREKCLAGLELKRRAVAREWAEQAGELARRDAALGAAVEAHAKVDAAREATWSWRAVAVRAGLEGKRWARAAEAAKAAAAAAEALATGRLRVRMETEAGRNAYAARIRAVDRVTAASKAVAQFQAQAHLADLKEVEATLQHRLAKAAEAHMTAAEAAGGARAETARLKAHIGTENSRLATRGGIADRESVLQAYRKVLDPRKGIAARLLARACAEIEARMNAVLVEFADFQAELSQDLVLSVAPGRAPRQLPGRGPPGGQTTGPTGNNGSIPADLASGYQRFALSLASRAALADMAEIPLPDCFVIDEGFGCLDDENLALMAQYIAAAAEGMASSVGVIGGSAPYGRARNNRLFFIVSHIESLRNAVKRPLHIEVSLDDGIPTSQVTNMKAPPLVPAEAHPPKGAGPESVAGLEPDQDDPGRVYCRPCERRLRAGWADRHLKSASHQRAVLREAAAAPAEIRLPAQSDADGGDIMGAISSVGVASDGEVYSAGAPHLSVGGRHSRVHPVNPGGPTLPLGVVYSTSSNIVGYTGPPPTESNHSTPSNNTNPPISSAADPTESMYSIPSNTADLSAAAAALAGPILLDPAFHVLGARKIGCRICRKRFAAGDQQRHLTSEKHREKIGGL